MGFWYRVRFPLLATGMIALLAGLWAGLLRLGWDVPVLRPFLPEAHGPLMAAGFLGVVIGLERAVALGRGWSYSVPALTGAGGLILIFGPPTALGPTLMTLGAAGLVLVNIALIRSQFALFTIVMGIGSVALLVGDVLWLSGLPIYRMVMWWAGFLILTIAAERLELSRFLQPTKTAQAAFVAATGVFIAGMIWMTFDTDIGAIAAGASMLMITAWLGRYDIARRTVLQTGLTRFVAVCLISGYAWLGVAGVLTILSGSWEPGFYYDGALHAVFLGFVFSMIFGHAPIIAPAVLKVQVPYTPVFYSHLALLHVFLVVRVLSDILDIDSGRMWGGLINEAALLLFIASTVAAALRGAKSAR